MPIRLPDPTEPLKIWRHLPYGELADLVMLDTRLWGRDQQPAMFDGTTDAPARTMRGFDQDAWLTAQIASSKELGAAWREIGRAMCRESGCRDVEVWGGGVSIKKKN